MDDVSRFASDRAFFSYCRLVPGADNSGDRIRHKRSRDGNRYLKLAFSHAAIRAIQYYPEVRAWYGSKRRRKPDVVARALVAKEIARIVYHVMRKQQDFNGQFKGKPLSRLKKEQWPLLPSPASITGDGEDLGPPTALGWNGKLSRRAADRDLGRPGRSRSPRPPSRPAVRARMGVWPASAPELLAALPI